MNNKKILKAKKNKINEFYTLEQTVEDELIHYKEDLKGKIVCLPCDTKKSAFYKFFKKHFKEYELKSVIVTNNHTKTKIVINSDLTEIETPLKENGDLFSEEIKEIIKKSDIIVTNPPFSIQRVFMKYLFEIDKKFIIIGNQLNVVTNDIFPHFKNNELFVGFTHRLGSMNFLNSKGEIKGVNGSKWFTNIKCSEIKDKLKHLPLKEITYLDGTNYLNISKVQQIPKDYNGLMSVPVSFLPYYDKEKYEIVAKLNNPFFQGKKIFKRLLIKEKQKEINTIELFGGIGAFSKALTLEKIKYNLLDYVENNYHSVNAFNVIHNKNYTPKDIKNINYKDFDKKVDILIHGSPCQDFSIIGNNKGLNGEKSSLLKETIRLLNEMPNKPKFVIWENVKYLLKKHKNVFDYYLDNLEKLGYKSDYLLMNSKDYGIPQQRERLICISCIDKNVDLNKIIKNIQNDKKELEKLSDFVDFDNVKPFKYTISEEKTPSMYYSKRKRLKDKNSLYVNTITTKQMRLPNSGIIKNDNGAERILTERECFLLMGFSNEDYNKTKNVVASSTELYKMAGNSIVVNILKPVVKEIKKEI